MNPDNKIKELQQQLDKLHEENAFFKENYKRYKDEAEKATSIINVSQTGTWEWNVQTGETIFNENWAQILGYTLGELQPISIKTWERLCHPGDYKHFENIFNQYMNGETDHYKAEVRMKHKEGHWVWVLDQGEIIQYDDNGDPLLLGGTHQDITPQKEAQFQAEKAKRLYAVISQVNQAIVHTNDVELLLNKVCNIAIDFGQFRMAWIGLFNDTQTNFETHSFAGSKTEFVKIAQNDENKKPFLCEFATRSILNGEKYICNNLENTKCNKTRKKRALEFGYQSSIALPIVMFNQTIGVFALYSEQSAYFNNDEINLLEEVIYDLGFALEVIENQKEHQKVIFELKQSEERFRMLAESAPAGIAITSNEGDILYLSPRFTEISGYTIADIPTLKNWWPLAYPDLEYRKQMVDKWEKAVNASNGSKSPVKKVKNKVKCKNDEVKDIEFRVATTNGNNYVIITDITERVEAEHKASERLKELNAFYKLGELTELKTIDRYELFDHFIEILPESMQYPDIAYGRIMFNKSDFKTRNYIENGKRTLKSSVIIDGKKSGFVEVGYISDKPDVYGTPFLKEERKLIDGLAERIGRIVESLKAEENLLYQIGFQKMVAEISSDFIRVNDGNIDVKIQSMLERLGHFFNVDRTYLFLFEDGYGIINNTHEWCSQGTSSVIETMRNFKTDHIPWWKDQIIQGKSINIPDISALPESAKNEQFLFQEQHIQSLLSVPVITHERIIGFFGFDAVKSKRNWSALQVEFLNILANILADAHVKVEAEAKIKESEEKYRLITENASDVIWVLNLNNMRFTYISPAIEMLRGLTPEEAMDETLQQSITRESFIRVNKFLDENLNDFINNTLENDYFIDEIQQPCKDGTIIWVEVSTKFRYNKNGEIEVIGVSRNIEGRKKLQAKIIENETKFRLLFENSPLGIYIANTHGKIEDANIALLKILRSPSIEKTKEINVLEFEPLVKNGYAKLFRECVDENKIITIELPYTSKWGKEVYLSSYLVPISNIQGRVDKVFTLMEDATERKNNELKLKKAADELNELNATKDKFFSIISHDLRSPFNSILGMSDLLVESADEMDVENLQRYAKVVRDSSERVMDLLTNLLDWSRAQTGRMSYNPEKIDVSTIVSETISLLNESARQKTVSLINIIPSSTFVQADRIMLSTVLRNLVSNAIKFSYPGGKVIIALLTKDDKTMISVSDEGVGIQAGTAKKLFRIDENVTTKGTNNEKGTGLGLILCKELVDKHGGEIWVKSNPNKGSVFYFTV